MPLSRSVLQADMINQSQQPFFLTHSSHLIQWSKQSSPTDHSWPTRGNLDMPLGVRQDTLLKITLLWVCVRPGKTGLIFNQPEFLWKQIRSYQVVECFTAEPHALPLLWSLTLRQSTNALLNDSDWENSGVQEKLAFGSGRQKSLKNKKEAPCTSDEETLNGSLSVVMLQVGHLLQACASATGVQPLTHFCKGNSKADGIHQIFSIKSK